MDPGLAAAPMELIAIFYGGRYKDIAPTERAFPSTSSLPILCRHPHHFRALDSGVGEEFLQNFFRGSGIKV